MKEKSALHQAQDRLKNPTKGMNEEQKLKWALDRIKMFNHHDEAEIIENYINNLLPQGCSNE